LQFFLGLYLYEPHTERKTERATITSSPTLTAATPTRYGISSTTHQRPTFVNISKLNSPTTCHYRRTSIGVNLFSPQNSLSANHHNSSATCALSQAIRKSTISFCEHYGSNDCHRASRPFCRTSRS
ncbi:hypothetical protein IscW_ISCW000065, partial [Ixodes scapularis]